jgi:hypothetical protein
MDSNRKIAIIVGILFIIATITSVVAGSLVESIIDVPGDLVNVSANENQLLIGVVFLIIGAVAVFNIPVMMYPILKRYSRVLALSYVGFRLFEAIIFMVDVMGVLLLITLSREFLSRGAMDASYVQALATLILAARDWGFLLVPVVFGMGAMVFYSLLYSSKLVPRWLAGWGFIGAALVLTSGLLGMFGNFLIYLALPIAVQEMLLAAWFIVKGFNFGSE